MEITKISSKGQVVIPIRMREDLGITEGSQVAIEKMNDVVMIKKLDLDLAKQFRKSLGDIKSGKIKRVA